jgi:hypothetical protein
VLHTAARVWPSSWPLAPASPSLAQHRKASDHTPYTASEKREKFYDNSNELGYIHVYVAVCNN